MHSPSTFKQDVDSSAFLKERLDAVFQRLPISIVASWLGMAVLWLWAASGGDNIRAGLWVASILGLGIARLVMRNRYMEARPRKSDLYWVWALVATTMGAAVIWAGFIFSLLQPGLSVGVAHVSLLVLVAIISITPFTVGIIPSVAAGHALSFSAIALYAAWKVFGADMHPIVVFVLVWTGLMLLLSDRMRREIQQQFALHAYNRDLLDDTQAAANRARESEEKFRMLLNLSADSYWETDSNHRFVPAVEDSDPHDEFASVARYGMAPWELTALRPLDGGWEALREAFDQHESFRDFPVRHVSGTGETRTFVISGGPIMDRDGRWVGFRGTSKDMTTRRRIESELADAKEKSEENNRQLQLSEGKFKALVEMSSDWYWERDAEHRLVSVEGQDKETLHPVSVSSIPWEAPNVHPVNTTWQAHRDTIEAQRPFRGVVLRLDLPNLTERYVMVNGAPFYDQRGVFVGYRGTTTDITAQKQTERALSQAKQEAEEANRAKSRFLANMSHEIRTPMNGVLGALQVIKRTEMSPEQSRLADIAQESGRALLQIIDSILDFSKIEAGQLEVESHPFDVIQCVQGVADLLTPSAQGKGLTLTVLFSETVPRHVHGDASRVRQILINLVGNAIKFTEAGHIRLQVDSDPTGTPLHGPALRFVVRDTGIGMTHAIQERLFQPFTQADSSMHRRFGGTGLGLAISKQLIECMGGEIGVDSTPGQGATFWFWLPLHPVAAELEEMSSRNAEVDSAELALTGGPCRRRVLLVEDNLVNQEVARAMLGLAGADVDVLANGRSAVEHLKNHVYDVVFMDCQMPEMDGFEATRTIRADEAGSGRSPAVIIALTANAMKGDRERCLAAGMDDYLTKPFTVADLQAMFDRWGNTTGRADVANARTPESS